MIGLPFTVYLTLCALRLASRGQSKAGSVGSVSFTISHLSFQQTVTIGVSYKWAMKDAR